MIQEWYKKKQPFSEVWEIGVRQPQFSVFDVCITVSKLWARRYSRRAQKSLLLMQPLTCARSVCCAPPCRHRTLGTHLEGLCVTSGPLGISVSWWVCVSSRRMRYTWSLLVKGQTELSKELQEMIMMSSPEGFFSLKPRLPSPPSQCCCKGEYAIEVHPPWLHFRDKTGSRCSLAYSQSSKVQEYPFKETERGMLTLSH